MLGVEATRRIGGWQGYALAALLCLISIMIRQALDAIFPPGFPFVTFFPAVILTAYLAGRNAGLFCMLLCTLAAWYLFIPPVNSFNLTGGVALALGFFVFVAGFDAFIIGHLKVVSARLDAERARSKDLFEQERVLFQELQHRVANNMQFVASLLHLQKRQIEADPSRAFEVLEKAARRIETMSGVHRRLYDATAIDVPIKTYLQELCSDVVKASGVKAVECSVEADPVRLDIERLMILSLITTELVTNSLKHAFTGDGGHINVRLVRLAAGRLEMTVADDGQGLPPGYAQRKVGLGTRVLRGLVAQLQATITTTSERGTTTRMQFPEVKQRHEPALAVPAQSVSRGKAALIVRHAS